MWKATLFSLAALLSIVHGYHPSNPRLGVASWDRMLSKIMVSGTNKGTCGDHCFVTLNGETKVFPIDVSVVFTSKPCTSFICTKDVVQEIQITCPKVDCNGAIPYRDPNSCCNRCPGGPDIEVEFEEWMEWTECSTTCGAGSRARRRTCKITDQDTVAECSGRLLETESCTLGPCPVDCEWKYGEFETCSRSCGAGQMSRFPIITQHPMNGGEPCPPFVVSGQPDVQPCNLRECPVDCDWEYEQFGQCSVSCGNGIKRQFPVITIQPKHGGAPCPDSVIDRVPNIEPCDAGPCPEDCEWEYEEFGDCSVTCGGGIKHQFPLIIRQATNGGVDCPAFVHRGDPNTMNCNTQPCPVDCEWEYEQFGECSKSCGEGIKTRYPRITVQPQHGGQDCPLFVQNREPDTTTCNNRPCPVHCEWKYGEYGECSKTCGGGTKTRFPVIITQPQYGGRVCPAHVIDGEPDSTSCNPLECPIVCGPGQTGCPNEAGELVCIDDKDGDCIPDTQDNCEKVFNPDQSDMDRDGVGGACDNCLQLYNPDQTNSDNDETGDECDPDDDNDGVVDQYNICQTVANSNQTDRDRDRVGDACDNCESISNANQADFDKDGVGNACDNCRFYPNPDQLSSDPITYGSLCTTRPSNVNMMGMEDENEDMDKKNMAAQIMEKLLEMYYSS